jgi:hypothetical protein
LEEGDRGGGEIVARATDELVRDPDRYRHHHVNVIINHCDAESKVRLFDRK